MYLQWNLVFLLLFTVAYATELPQAVTITANGNLMAREEYAACPSGRPHTWCPGRADAAQSTSLVLLPRATLNVGDRVMDPHAKEAIAALLDLNVPRLVVVSVSKSIFLISEPLHPVFHFPRFLLPIWTERSILVHPNCRLSQRTLPVPLTVVICRHRDPNHHHQCRRVQHSHRQGAQLETY